MDSKDCWYNIITYIDVNSYLILLSITKFTKCYIKLICQQLLENKYKITNCLFRFQTYTNSFIAYYNIQIMRNNYKFFSEQFTT